MEIAAASQTDVRGLFKQSPQRNLKQPGWRTELGQKESFADSEKIFKLLVCVCV